MADLSKLHQLLDWKLLKGPHKFPGPDGGTCINEAALVAAGFPYRAVGGSCDLPPCFSRELGHLLLHANDNLGDNERQLLKPFVLVLAGSAASAEVEKQRCEFIIRELLGVNGLADMRARHRNLDATPFRLDALEATWSETPNVDLETFLDVIRRAFEIGRTTAMLDLDTAKRRLEDMRAVAAKSHIDA